jgi:hypothetical protein
MWPCGGDCWRLVEAQHKVSTLKLTDTLAEQALLESLLEETKPKLPEEAKGLHYLMAAPFRYGAPYPRGSRFRRAGRTPGFSMAPSDRRRPSRKFRSARDPDHGHGPALLAPAPFIGAEPVKFETWRIRVGPFGAQAIREFPTERHEFSRAAFAADRRLDAMAWTR